MTSLMAAHALSFLRSFLSLSLCLIDDYGSDPAPLASDRFADLEIEIGELSRGASARDATCVTSKVQNCNWDRLALRAWPSTASGTAMRCAVVIWIDPIDRCDEREIMVGRCNRSALQWL